MRPRTITTALLVACAVGLIACGGSSAPQRDLADVQILHGGEPQDASAGQVGSYVPTGKLIADTGFRPPKDGFGFENYGDLGAVSKLTPAAVEQLFGAKVCASGSGSTCQLIPPAKAWLEAENDAMAAGHCFGIAVSAARFYGRQLDADSFGASSPRHLPIASNAALQRTIAQANALQELPSVRSTARSGSSNQILDTLIAGMRRRTLYVLGLFRTGGGHAVTPYAVEDRGNGRYAVLVYDSNFPGITRAVSFDRHADAWKFVAQTNPGDPRQVYSGHGAQSGLAVYPALAPRGILPCPFCGDPSAKGVARVTAHQFNEIALEGDPANHAHLLISDAQGRHTGYIRHQFVDEIPGAQILRRLNNRSWKESAEPVYLIPAGRSISVRVDGATLTQPAVERLELIGPGDRVAVEGIGLKPGEHITTRFAGDGSRISLTTHRHHNESPLLRVGIEGKPDSYDFALKATRLKGGSTLTLRLDQPRLQIDIDTKGVLAAARYELSFNEYAIDIARMMPSGTLNFHHAGLQLPAGTVARLDYGQLTTKHRTLDLELTRRGKTRVQSIKG